MLNRYWQNIFLLVMGFTVAGMSLAIGLIGVIVSSIEDEGNDGRADEPID